MASRYASVVALWLLYFKACLLLAQVCLFPVLDGWSLSLANSIWPFLLCPGLEWEGWWLSAVEKCSGSPKNRCPENHFRASKHQRICGMGMSLPPVWLQANSLASEVGRVSPWLSWEGRGIVSDSHQGTHDGVATAWGSYQAAHPFLLPLHPCYHIILSTCQRL